MADQQEQQGTQSSRAIMQSPLLYCDVCEVNASSEQQLRAHLLGQRHFYNVRQREIAHRSVYVSGFKSGEIEEEAVIQLFQMFGNVHKVVIVSEKRPKPFAIVEFSDPDSAIRALRYTDELNFQGSTLKVKPREIRNKTVSNKKSKTDMAVAAGSVAVDASKKTTTCQNASPASPGEAGIAPLSPVAMETEGSDTSTSCWKEVLRAACLNAQSEDIRKLEDASTVDEQMEILVALFQLPTEALRQRMNVVSQLEAHFRSAFPSCRVLPFGSFVTGLSTPTSDLDLVLITEFTREDDKYFGSTANYLPLLPDMPMSPHPPPETECCLPEFDSIATTAEDMDVSCDSSSSSSSTPLSTPAKEGLEPVGFQTVYTLVHRIPECVKVLGLPTARCPIIRFHHQPTGIHCDLSINNRLGPHNTRLLKSYLQFDRRVVPLLLVLRLWVRGCGIMGIGRTQLNNYSLTLMLISALQSTSPPVLPCLQNPIGWPRNMEWYEQQGFSDHSVELAPVMANGWNVQFCNSSALKPSKNTASLSELLHHFFNFYVNFNFGAHVVTVHNRPGHTATMQEVLDYSSRIAAQLPDAPTKTKHFNVRFMCMCVQDPMELTHNVTKSISHNTYSLLMHELRRGNERTVELTTQELTASKPDKQCLLELLSPSEELPQRSKMLKLTHLLNFTPMQLKILFQKCDELSSVADIVGELDCSIQGTAHKLCLLALKALVYILKKEVGIVCQPIPTSDIIQKEFEPMESFSESTIESVVASDRKKRLRNEELESSEEVTQQGQLAGEEKQPTLDGTKRRRLSPSHSEICPDSILDKFVFTDTGQYLPSSYNCLAYSNTWVHRRRARRQQQQAQEVVNSSVAELADSLPPVLTFTMSTPLWSALPSAQPSGQDCVEQRPTISAQVATDEPKYAKELGTFYAFFKKLIRSLK